jgi:DnaJ-class molecular chaperone
MSVCKNCNGTGRVDLPKKPEISFTEQGDCPACDGTGKVEEVKSPEAPVESPKEDGATDSQDGSQAPE